MQTETAILPVDPDEAEFRIYAPRDLGRRRERAQHGEQLSAAAAATTPHLRVVPFLASETTTPSESTAFDAEAVDASAVRAQLAVTPRVQAVISASVESELLAILSGTALIGETIEAAYTRKEHALGNAFARLSALECRALHSRLSGANATDQLVQQFLRMTSPRRARLLGFLAGARRREVLAAGRR